MEHREECVAGASEGQGRSVHRKGEATVGWKRHLQGRQSSRAENHLEGVKVYEMYLRDREKLQTKAKQSNGWDTVQ